MGVQSNPGPRALTPGLWLSKFPAPGKNPAAGHVKSSAAALVNVMVRIRFAGTPDRIRASVRQTIVVVLPDPGTARSAAGPPR